MQQTINIPEGFELVQTSDTAYEIKKKESQLPKTWEEFCMINPIKKEEALIDIFSDAVNIHMDFSRDPITDRNMLPTRKDAEGILALMQLIQLRDYYNDGWRPDWTDASQNKYVIYRVGNTLSKSTFVAIGYSLAFKTPELRDEFLGNFRDLIEVAKDFI